MSIEMVCWVMALHRLLWGLLGKALLTKSIVMSAMIALCNIFLLPLTSVHSSCSSLYNGMMVLQVK